MIFFFPLFSVPFLPDDSSFFSASFCAFMDLILCFVLFCCVSAFCHCFWRLVLLLMWGVYYGFFVGLGAFFVCLDFFSIYCHCFCQTAVFTFFLTNLTKPGPTASSYRSVGWEEASVDWELLSPGFPGVGSRDIPIFPCLGTGWNNNQHCSL